MKEKLRLGELLSGSAGTAQEVVLVTPATLDESATLASYFITAPGQSIAWDKYMLHIISLADIPGVKPAWRAFPSATHEIMMFALDPDAKSEPLKRKTWKRLTPHNLVEQVELPDDDAARRLLHMSAKAIVAGILWAEPPLSGQNDPWHTALIRASAHLRGEPHDSGMGYIWHPSQGFPTGDLPILQTDEEDSDPE